MKYLNKRHFLALFLTLVFSNAGNAEILFYDSFESVDLSAPSSPSPATNQINFDWESTNYTALVTMDPGPVKVFGMVGNMYRPEDDQSKNWAAKDGNISLRFNYNAGMNMSEQRFNFDAMDELWLRYWVRVPTNFYHGGQNNKFLALWGQGYDRDGDITWQTRPSGAGNANLVVQDGGTQSPETLSTPFIRTSDAGRWMQMVFHVRAASSANSNDGLLRVYRRWEDESSFTLLQENSRCEHLWNADGLGFRAGYLMGWANDPYNQQTEWLIDTIEIADTPLIDDAEPTPVNASAVPPSNFRGSVSYE